MVWEVWRSIKDGLGSGWSVGHEDGRSKNDYGKWGLVRHGRRLCFLVFYIFWKLLMVIGMGVGAVFGGNLRGFHGGIGC